MITYIIRSCLRSWARKHGLKFYSRIIDNRLVQVDNNDDIVVELKYKNSDQNKFGLASFHLMVDNDRMWLRTFADGKAVNKIFLLADGRCFDLLNDALNELVKIWWHNEHDA